MLSILFFFSRFFAFFFVVHVFVSNQVYNFYDFHHSYDIYKFYDFILFHCVFVYRQALLQKIQCKKKSLTNVLYLCILF